MLGARSTVLPALMLVLAYAVAGCGDDSTPRPADAENLVTVTIAGGTVTPAPGTVEVPVGEDVTLDVTSDVAEEVHVHGYDKTLDLEPGETASLTFTADIPGVFEVELEGAGTLLFELEVQ